MYPLLAALTGAANAAVSSAELSSLSFEELASIEITSVSKRAEPLADAAAAVYVISNEDIRRSGATSIPEALRLAPNLQVARIDSSTYAITARGFNNGSTANKLLVLIDGRSVYTPLFSGVFWDAQDLLLADIERIEVVSGPGGTLWGANAVNGVINIITYSSRQTPDTILGVGGGNDEQLGVARAGGHLGNRGTFRVYGKSFVRDNTTNMQGDDRPDAWKKNQGGFRMDWHAARDTWTLQGDAYDGSLEQQPSNTDEREISGGNLLGRWTRELDNNAGIQLQAYIDQTNRNYPGVFDETLNTFDVSLLHHLQAGSMHEIVWGGGYRLAQDEVANNALLAFLPPEKDLSLSNIFMQDSISLRDNLKFTVGSKFEENDYTGWEIQPSVRLAWKPADDVLLWSAVSRAVRTPSRIDRDFYVPATPPFLLAGGPDFESEELTAYEFGYRGQPASNLMLSVSLFYNVYDKLRSFEGTPLVAVNNIDGHTEGGELWGSWQAADWWRLSAGYNYLRKELEADTGGSAALVQTGNDPRHQLFLRSHMNLPNKAELDLHLRSIAELPYSGTPEYTVLDARIGWRLTNAASLSLNVANMLRPPHMEFGNPALATTSALKTSYFIDFRWSFQ